MTTDEYSDRKRFWGHSGPVHTVAYSPDGRFLAAGGFGKTVRVYQANGEPHRALRGHLDWVNGVAFSPDSTLLASGSSDWTVRLWDPVTGADRGVHREHQDWVRGVAFSRAGGRLTLASAGADAKVVVWDVAAGEVRHVLPAEGWVNAVVFHPTIGGQLAFAGDDGHVHLRNLRRPREHVALGGGHGHIRSIAYDARGDRIAGAALDGTVWIWSLGDSREPRIWKAEPEDEVVRALAFAEDGSLALGGVQGRVRLWRRSEARPDPPFDGDAGYVNTLAFDPAGEVLATGSEDDRIRFWNVAGRRVVEDVQLHDGGVRGLAFSGDGRRLASGGSDRSVRVWDAETGALVCEGEGHAAWVNAVAFHPVDDGLLASGSGDKTAMLWDLRDMGSGPKAVFRGHEGFVRALAFDPLGQRLATGCSDTRVRVFDVGAGDVTPRFDLAGHGEQVNSVAFHPEGTMLASASHDGTVRLWREAEGTGTYEVLQILQHRERVNTVAFSPDGSMIATGSGDKLVTLWDTATLKRRAELRGHQEFVRALAFHPTDPDMLASAGADRTIRLWSLSGRRALRELAGHDDWVRCLAFAGRIGGAADRAPLLASGAADGTIRLWDPRTGRQVLGTRRRNGPGRRSGASRAAGSVVLASDEPSEEDRIGFARDVEILAQLTAAVQTRPPLAIALAGPWGAGKSSFLRQLDLRIGRLVAASRSRYGFSAFVPRVCRVHFNAWHYSDGQVLVGIAEQLFRELDVELNPEVGRPGRTVRDWFRASDQADHERAVAETAVKQAQARLDQAVSSRLRVAGVARQAAVPLVVWGAAAVLYVAERTVVAAGIGALAGFVSTVAVAWQGIRARRKEVEAARRGAEGAVTAVRGLRKPGPDKVDALTKAVGDAKERVRVAEGRVRRAKVLGPLAELVGEISSDKAFADVGGLTHRIRETLDNLDRVLAEAQERWLASDGSWDEPPPGRVVLYIDDLDRCQPKQVVDVLAAVHMLLAFRLFVVVVAIDPQWVLRCLEVHHEHIRGDDGKAREAASWNYLDKIFQVPFAIPYFDEQAAEKYVGHLVANALSGALGPVSSTTPRGPEDPATDSAPVAFAVDGAQTGGRVAPTNPNAPNPYEGDLMPRDLELTELEAHSLMQVGFLTPTPRAAKKLVNLYRVVRMGVPDLDEFLADECRHTVVQLLLGVVVSVPAHADEVFRQITATKRTQIGAVFTEALVAQLLLPPKPPAPAAWRMLRARLDGWGSGQVLPLVAEWAPQLRRYSFHSWKDDTPLGGGRGTRWAPWR